MLTHDISEYRRKEKISDYVLVASAAGLLAIWPLPETMALRNLLYFTGILATLFLCTLRENRLAGIDFWTNLPLIAFFAWITAHYVFLSELKEAQFKELVGFWLRSFMAMIIGFGIGTLLLRKKHDWQQHASPQDNFSRIIFLALLGTLAVYLTRYTYEVISTGKLLHKDFYMTPFKGKPQVIVFIGILLTALFARISQIIDANKGYREVILPLILTILCLAVFYTANTKNGFLIFTLMSAALCIKFAGRKLINYRTMVAFLIALLPLAILVEKHVEANPAWKTIIQDVKAGIDIDHHSYWRNWISEPMPINELGVEVNQSTYLRTAWLVAATELIQDRPLGYGLMSYSFSYLAKKKWPDFYSAEGDHMVATHSGWIDLTLAFGLPATTLLLFSICRSYILAFRGNGFWYRYMVWTIPFILIAYMTVEVSYDIFFELLLFLASLFGTLTSRPTFTSETRA